ncbi:MAG: winged helix-turn-helix transcriptional regulator [Ignavibacteria bacterium]|nr:winged helix-turn-helix transcriptional regulator [Ignavibacteria bacterium]
MRGIFEIHHVMESRRDDRIIGMNTPTPSCGTLLPILNTIVNELPLAQPTVSQHLKELKNAGIIKGEIEGNSICYCLNMDTLQKLAHYCQSIISTQETQNNSCC